MLTAAALIRGFLSTAAAAVAAPRGADSTVRPTASLAALTPATAPLPARSAARSASDTNADSSTPADDTDGS
ncbi:hypothetical protein [Mycobacterium sp. URHB0021]